MTEIMTEAISMVKFSSYIPLNNRIRGPYCKLRTEFFPIDLWPKRECINRWGKRGSVTYSTDRENEVSNYDYISTVCLTGSGTISIHAERLQILTHLESKTTPFEIIVE